MATSTRHDAENDVAILARLLSNGQGKLPRDIARYILTLGFNDQDKARMHELAVRNQGDGLSAAEKEEMHAFGRAGTLLSILKSKARRTLGVKLESRSVS